MIIERNGKKIKLTTAELRQAFTENNQLIMEDKLTCYITPYMKIEKLDSSEWDAVRKMTMKRYRHLNTDDLSEAQKWVSCIEHSIMIIRNWHK